MCLKTNLITKLKINFKFASMKEYYCCKSFWIKSNQEDLRYPACATWRLLYLQALSWLDSNQWNDGVKVRCLTAWLHLNMSNLIVFWLLTSVYEQWGTELITSICLHSNRKCYDRTWYVSVHSSVYIISTFEDRLNGTFLSYQSIKSLQP